MRRSRPPLHRWVQFAVCALLGCHIGRLPELFVQPSLRGDSIGSVVRDQRRTSSALYGASRPRACVCALGNENADGTGGPLPLTVGMGTCLVPNDPPPFWDIFSEKVGVEQQIEWGLQSGYRVIDTAWRYGNERGIGKEMKKAFESRQLRRDDVFVITKLWCDYMNYDNTLESIDIQLKYLQLDYIDLYLVHWPGDFGQTTDASVCQTRRRETWKALEKAAEMGKIRNIGVANYAERHLRELLEYAMIRPAVNQIEVHPYNARAELIDFCKSEGIQVMGYCPLGGRNAGGEGTGVTDELLSDPTISKIAQSFKKTNAQVLLRWALQRGVVPIPKASSLERIAENQNVFDFELSEPEMDRITALDKGEFVVFDGNRIP